MRPYRARFRGQGVFFAFQSWAACITNIFGFDLRQAHQRLKIAEELLIPALLRDRTRQTRSLSSFRTFDSDFATRVPAQDRMQADASNHVCPRQYDRQIFSRAR